MLINWRCIGFLWFILSWVRISLLKLPWSRIWIDIAWRFLLIMLLNVFFFIKGYFRSLTWYAISRSSLAEVVKLKLMWLLLLILLFTIASLLFFYVLIPDALAFQAWFNILLKMCLDTRLYLREIYWFLGIHHERKIILIVVMLIKIWLFRLYLTWLFLANSPLSSRSCSGSWSIL